MRNQQISNSYLLLLVDDVLSEVLVVLGDLPLVLFGAVLKDGELLEWEVPTDKLPPSRSGTGELDPDLATSSFFLPPVPIADRSIDGDPVALLESPSFLRGMDLPALIHWLELERWLEDPSEEWLGGNSFGLPLDLPD